MQYIAIKEIEKDGKTVYCVPAIPLKNKNQSVVQKIPHPMGSDILEYATLEQAQDVIKRSGFACIMPNGKKVVTSVTTPVQKVSSTSYEQIIFETIKSKIFSNNTNVSSSAILAISEFPKPETFDILFEKMGEDNDLVRKNAISGICRYGKLLQNEVINQLKSDNWVTRNSAITCIKNISEQEDVDTEKFIMPLIEVCQDQNPVVQSNAILALSTVYAIYKSQK